MQQTDLELNLRTKRTRKRELLAQMEYGMCGAMG